MSAATRRPMGGAFALRLTWALGAVAAAGALLVLLCGGDPLQAAMAMVRGAFGDRYSIAETLLNATPLALVALSATLGLRAGIFSVGAEGQLVAGAVSATALLVHLPNAAPALLIAVGALAGVAGGMAWGLIPALLRAYGRTNEILSTLLLNYVAANGLVWLLRTTLATSEAVAVPRSEALPAGALIPHLIPTTRLHWGILAVPIAALLVAWWQRSPRGLAYDVLAARPALAARMGLSERRAVIVTFVVSGGVAGLVGWMQVAGVAGTLYPGVSGGLGFTGVLIALLGGLQPLGILGAAFFFGALITGSDGLQTGTGVPSSIALVLEGLLLFAAALTFVARRKMAAPTVMVPTAFAAEEGR